MVLEAGLPRPVGGPRATTVRGAAVLDLGERVVLDRARLKHGLPLSAHGTRRVLRRSWHSRTRRSQNTLSGSTVRRQLLRASGGRRVGAAAHSELHTCHLKPAALLCWGQRTHSVAKDVTCTLGHVIARRSLSPRCIQGARHRRRGCSHRVALARSLASMRNSPYRRSLELLTGTMLLAGVKRFLVLTSIPWILIKLLDLRVTKPGC
jgi:hypothetical protein